MSGMSQSIKLQKYITVKLLPHSDTKAKFAITSQLTHKTSKEPSLVYPNALSV